MIVRPSGKTHFCAELGGNVITAESSVAAAFKLVVVNMSAAKSARRGAVFLIKASALANRVAA